MESIDLISFLHNYYGISSEFFYKNVVTHQDIKMLFPSIKRESFDYVNHNREDLSSGDIILVHDAKGNTVPYVKPTKEDLKEFGPFQEMTEKAGNLKYKVVRERIIVDEEMLDSLSKDELLKLRRDLKRTRQYCKEKKVVKAIRSKKSPKVKAYKRKKNELKNGGYYD